MKKKENAELDISTAPIQSILLTAKTLFEIVYAEYKNMDLTGYEPFPCSPYKAIQQVNLRRMKGMKDGTIPLRTSVNCLAKTSLIVVPKQVVMGSSLLVDSKLIEGVFFEEHKLPALYPTGKYLVKSYVVDALEFDPEISEAIIGDEKDVKSFEFDVSLFLDSIVQFSFVYSGYDRSKSIPNIRVATQRLRENPVFTFEPVDGEVRFKLFADLADIREFYTRQSVLHKKFKKYNPRQYCYLTLYFLCESAINRVNIKVSRLYSLMPEKGSRIYKGPDIRKGVVQKVKRNYAYDFVTGSILQQPSVMTDNRWRIVCQDALMMSDGVVAESKSQVKIATQGYSVDYSENGGITQYSVDQRYQLRTIRLRELADDPYCEDYESD